MARHTALLPIGALALTLGASASAAPEALVEGTAEADDLRGTPGADLIIGREGDDTIDGGEGDATVDAGPGEGSVRAGDGSDVIEAHDGERDTVLCRGDGETTTGADASTRLCCARSGR